MRDARNLVDHLFRRKSGEMIASLTRILGPTRIDLAEDVVQDALIAALRTWPHAGIPERPEAWLVQVAKNRALDRLRRIRSLSDKEAEIVAWSERGSNTSESLDIDELADDQLRMMFTCCDLSLAPEVRVALTLKTLCGFSVPEIARAFLAQEETIAQRIVRAKRRLRAGEIEFAFPVPKAMAERVESVHGVLYLMFNEGYTAHAGRSLVRVALIEEALRLLSLLNQHEATDRPEGHALHALMLFQAARLATRTDEAGDLLLMADQDRTRWNHGMIARAFQELQRSSTGDALSPYHIEAAIASCHASAPRFEDTNWNLILEQYDALLRLRPSPIVELNRVVALSMVHGPGEAVRALKPLEGLPALAGYYLLPAVHGDLLRKLGDRTGAAICYRRAAELACSAPERQFIQGRLAECEAPS